MEAGESYRLRRAELKYPQWWSLEVEVMGMIPFRIIYICNVAGFQRLEKQ